MNQSGINAANPHRFSRDSRGIGQADSPIHISDSLNMNPSHVPDRPKPRSAAAAAAAAAPHNSRQIRSGFPRESARHRLRLRQGPACDCAPSRAPAPARPAAPANPSQSEPKYFRNRIPPPLTLNPPRLNSNDTATTTNQSTTEGHPPWHTA